MLSEKRDRDQVRAALSQLAPIPARSLEVALDDFSVQLLPRGAHLLRAGERASWVGLVSAGLLREYYVTADGDEHVRTFGVEGTWTGSLYDLLRGEPAVASIQALEPTRLFVTPWPKFQARCEREPVWHQAGRRVAEALYVLKVQREYQMLALAAPERYAALRRQSPTLEGRITQRQLAAYLGVTPEHLSRIRARARGAPARAGRSRRAR